MLGKLPPRKTSERLFERFYIPALLLGRSKVDHFLLLCRM
jgi:hypothetical protein